MKLIERKVLRRKRRKSRVRKKITGTSDRPRLTVFRKIDGAWKVSAHANFAPFEQPSDN